MLFTKECDYSIRILRALSDGELHNVNYIAKEECISKPITYKLTRLLEIEGFLKSYRGVQGGYIISKPLDQVTLFDVGLAINKSISLNSCLETEECGKYKDCKGMQNCAIHNEMGRIQNMINNELQSKSLAELFECKAK
ncbi:MAG: Rrf2 family transcriptional regulator [Lachnospiraceae bacterium]|jgi:Rrf2 family protein|nr:Rrf2 family transcriptional regulator [Lachnospiraceae bacterium]